MSSSLSVSEPLSGSSTLDWDELAGLDRIVTAYAIGDHSVVLETTDGREIRITAWHDRARRRYLSEYERRSVVRSGGAGLRAWVQAPSCKRRTDHRAARELRVA